MRRRRTTRTKKQRFARAFIAVALVWLLISILKSCGGNNEAEAESTPAGEETVEVVAEATPAVDVAESESETAEEAAEETEETPAQEPLPAIEPEIAEIPKKVKATIVTSSGKEKDVTFYPLDNDDYLVKRGLTVKKEGETVTLTLKPEDITDFSTCEIARADGLPLSTEIVHYRTAEGEETVPSVASDLLKDGGYLVLEGMQVEVLYCITIKTMHSEYAMHLELM